MLAPRFSNRRLHRKYRLRFKVRGSSQRPRLSVFRSAKHIYAQVIDDDSGRTIASASSVEEALKGFEGDKTAIATKVGELVADRAIAAGVSHLVFDRNGFKYTGRVAAVSKAAHDKGLLGQAGFQAGAEDANEQE